MWTDLPSYCLTPEPPGPYGSLVLDISQFGTSQLWTSPPLLPGNDALLTSTMPTQQPPSRLPGLPFPLTKSIASGITHNEEPMSAGHYLPYLMEMGRNLPLLLDCFPSTGYLCTFNIFPPPPPRNSKLPRLGELDISTYPPPIGQWSPCRGGLAERGSVWAKVARPDVPRWWARTARPDVPKLPGR